MSNSELPIRICHILFLKVEKEDDFAESIDTSVT